MQHVHLVLPLEIFCIKIVFNNFWNDCNTQEKLKAKVMQSFRGQTRCIMGDMPMENCGSKRNKGHTNEVNNPLSSFPFSFFFFFIFFHSECSCGN